MSPLSLSFPCHSAGRDGVRPAAELRHIQRHGHEQHVSRALRACPASSLHSWVLPACCLRRRRPTPSRLPACMSPLSLSFLFASAGREGVQPAAELRHVQRHNHGIHVPGALRACPASSLHSCVHTARCLRRRRATTSRLPARMAPLFLCFPFLSADRVRVQPAAEPRHVQRHKHAEHVYGALRTCPASSLHSWVLPARCLRRRRPTPPPASKPTCHPIPYPSLSTRQGAAAFNQPLSFDTSGVTSMFMMFQVLHECPASKPPQLGPPCTLLAPPPPLAASRSACCPSFLCFPFHSAGSDGVQPAAEPRHVQRHKHAQHVLCALRTCPCQQPSQLGPPLLAPPPPHALPPPGPHATPLPILPLDSTERDGVQPAAELRHVQRHNHGIHVPGALRACPVSSLHSWVHTARCLRRRRATPSRLPASMSPLFLWFPLVSAECGGVQPTAELRHVQRHSHAVHV